MFIITLNHRKKTCSADAHLDHMFLAHLDHLPQRSGRGDASGTWMSMCLLSNSTAGGILLWAWRKASVCGFQGGLASVGPGAPLGPRSGVGGWRKLAQGRVSQQDPTGFTGAEPDRKAVDLRSCWDRPPYFLQQRRDGREGRFMWCNWVRLQG